MFVTTVFSLLPAFLMAENCAHDPHAFRCVQYVGNYDGDTIKVNIPNTHPLIGENISVRVLGLDTPEMKGKGPCEKRRATEARELVKTTLIHAKQINLLNVQRDKYFRILAEVVADGVSLKDLLLKKQLAYGYDGGTKKNMDWCVRGPAIAPR